MKKLKLFTYLLFIILIINACSKGCPDGAPTEKNVDKTYLPFIIPYSDTSTRLFLKNGKDTLLFKSQGLKETTEIQGAGGESCDTYKLQQYSLKMAASDTDYFEVSYFAIINGIPSFLYAANFSKMNEVDFDFLGWRSISVLNNNYDSVAFNHNDYKDSVYSKSKIGAIRIKTGNNVYELIK